MRRHGSGHRVHRGKRQKGIMVGRVVLQSNQFSMRQPWYGYTRVEGRPGLFWVLLDPRLGPVSVYGINSGDRLRAQRIQRERATERPFLDGIYPGSATGSSPAHGPGRLGQARFWGRGLLATGGTEFIEKAGMVLDWLLDRSPGQAKFW